MQYYSVFERQLLKDKIQQNSPYHLIVIGGGVTGAGIALDAASRGMKVCLVEKQDFASGTSSKSTKLIHGGLRYLKQFEFKLVAETGRERAVIHHLAPHLVHPEKMLLPIFKNGSMGKFTASLGIRVYDLLAGVEWKDQMTYLDENEVRAIEPLLASDKLLGGCLYAEYRTDDARLTIELVKTAIAQGADCINYVEVNDFITRNDRVVGVKSVDVLSGEHFHIEGKVVVNAAGPWVDGLREKDGSKKGKTLHLTKGVHLVTPHQRFPLKQSIYFDVPDGRMIFAIPRGQVTYFGTTDTDYHGTLDKVVASADDVDYLINAVNSTFPDLDLSRRDIQSSWAGLRPLIHEQGKSASEISRKDEIFVSASGLLSIAGGKLTGYRLMARKAVNRVEQFLRADEGLSFKACQTKNILLCGNNFHSEKDVLDYQENITDRIKEFGLEARYGQYLVQNYGYQTQKILELVAGQSGEPDPALRLLRCELQYCLQHEMVCTPLDFLTRRTGRMYFDMALVKQYYSFILKDFQNAFAWTETQYETQHKEVLQSIEDLSMF